MNRKKSSSGDDPLLVTFVAIFFILLKFKWSLGHTGFGLLLEMDCLGVESICKEWTKELDSKFWIKTEILTSYNLL